MLLLALTASFAMQAPPVAADLGGANRNSVREALVDAQVAILRIGHCTTERPAREDLEEEYQGLSDQLLATSTTAEAFYPDIDVNMEAAVRTTGGRAPRCTAAAVRTYVADARLSLAAADAGIRSDAARRHGLWLGNLHLCRGRVTAVERGEPRFEGERPGFVLHFAPDFAPQVLVLSTQRVGKSLSVVLDGVVIMSPA